MSNRPVDPSALVDGNGTRGDLDVDLVIERWAEIEELGHPLGPSDNDGGRDS